MARRAIQLKLHGQIVQSVPLAEADIECLLAAKPDMLVDIDPSADRFSGP